jgi:hypothetical protein
MQALAMPQTAEPWSLIRLLEKLIKIGVKVAMQWPPPHIPAR